MVVELVVISGMCGISGNGSGGDSRISGNGSGISSCVTNTVVE